MSSEQKCCPNGVHLEQSSALPGSVRYNNMVSTIKDRKRIALCSLILAVCAKKRKKRAEKGEWCKNWLMKRRQLGSHVTILRELQNGYEKDFINYMRMDPNTFNRLLTLVTPAINKQDTTMRMSIPAEARLEATLLYLSTGCSYTYLQYTTRISKQRLSKIVPETCQAMYQVLREQYLQVRHCNLLVYFGIIW